MTQIAGQYRLSRWMVLLIWLAAIGAVVFCFAYFSGRWSPFSAKEKQASAPTVVAPPPATPLVRPAQADTPSRPPAQPPRQPPIDIDRQKALASDIRAFPGARGAAPISKASADGRAGDAPGRDQDDPLEASLQPTRVDGTEVAELPSPRWMIKHGRILPCNLQLKENSTLPGMLTANLAEDIYGDTGDTKLLPKGSEIFGTVQHALVNGLDRLAVLWQDITTPVIYDARGLPHHYRVTTNSPATSELGETGLDGDINRHLFNPFPGKLGALIGMSLIQGGIQAGAQAASHGNGNTNNSINFNSFQQGGDSAAETLLRSYVTIPDVLTRNQGTVCGVGVIRDLNMHKAYRLLREKGAL
jgi:type IV secretion system protein VirB10